MMNLGKLGGPGGLDLGGMIEKLRPLNRLENISSTGREGKSSHAAEAVSATANRAAQVSINRNADGSVTIVENLTNDAGKTISRSRTVSRDSEGTVFVHEDITRPDGKTASRDISTRQENGVLQRSIEGTRFNGDTYSRDLTLSRSAPLISLNA